MDEFQDMLKRLSEDQVELWRRAGYPGIRDRDPEKIRPFLKSILKKRETVDGA